MSLDSFKKMQKSGTLKEVMVQITRPEYWRINKKHRFCTQMSSGKKDPKDVLYVAFYRTTEDAITHIAEVKGIEADVHWEKAYKTYALPKKIRDEATGKTRVKVYRLKELKLLRNPIERKGGITQDFRYTTIGKLFTAKTTKDL